MSENLPSPIIDVRAQLAALDKARQLLASPQRTAKNIEAVRAFAAGLRAAAASCSSASELVQVRVEAAEVEARAERDLGAVFSDSRTASQAREELGVLEFEKSEVSRWRSIARVPVDAFERALAEARSTRRGISQTKLLKLAPPRDRQRRKAQLGTDGIRQLVGGRGAALRAKHPDGPYGLLSAAAWMESYGLRIANLGLIDTGANTWKDLPAQVAEVALDATLRVLQHLAQAGDPRGHPPQLRGTAKNQRAHVERARDLCAQALDAVQHATQPRGVAGESTEKAIAREKAEAEAEQKRRWTRWEKLTDILNRAAAEAAALDAPPGPEAPPRPKAQPLPKHQKELVQLETAPRRPEGQPLPSVFGYWRDDVVGTLGRLVRETAEAEREHRKRRVEGALPGLEGLK